MNIDYPNGYDDRQCNDAKTNSTTSSFLTGSLSLILIVGEVFKISILCNQHIKFSGIVIFVQIDVNFIENSLGIGGTIILF